MQCRALHEPGPGLKARSRPGPGVKYFDRSNPNRRRRLAGWAFTRAGLGGLPADLRN